MRGTSSAGGFVSTGHRHGLRATDPEHAVLEPVLSLRSVVPRTRKARVATLAVSAAVAAPLIYGCTDLFDPEWNTTPRECRAATAAKSSGSTAEQDRKKRTISAKEATGGPAGTVAPPADFDGDGRTDLATGGAGVLDGENLAGQVAVMYGRGAGGGPVRCQVLTQDDDRVPGEIRAEAKFGEESAARDFDEDGYTDLAVGTAKEVDGGSVILLWGSAEGLGQGTVVKGASFDSSDEVQLAAGDFDGDGHADLAMRPGSEKGLLKGPFDRQGRPARASLFHGPAVAEERLSDLVAGDINGDGTTDLVTFHTNEDGEPPMSAYNWKGNYLQGSKDGFEAADPSPVPDGETGVVGDVDKDGYGDLIVSPRGEDVTRKGKLPCCDVIDGAVQVVHGSKDGPSRRKETIDADTPGVPGNREQYAEEFFTALDAADVNGDGYADVVAGAPGSEAGDARSGAGIVLFLYGGSGGLTGEKSRFLDQTDVKARPEMGDEFGHAVRLADMDHDRKADLAVGAQGEAGSGRFSGGAAWILPGTGDGLNPKAATAFRAADFGLPDDESPHFGEAFAK
jgi:hypothetical protein